MRYALTAGLFLLEDLLSTVFFMVLISVTHDLTLATVAAIVIGVAQVTLCWIRKKPVDAMQWLSLGLVVVMGGASLLTHDPRFVMVKPTVILTAVGVVMLKKGWMNRYLPEVVTSHAPELGMTFGYLWAGMMFATAGLNLVVAFGTDPRTWALVMSTVPLASKIALFAIQFATMRILVGRKVRAARLMESTLA
ncbi:septation protein IspZ [Caulobacter sp. NIBR1757]|uniref:inner membrane-spanning protein YciB n=1 Tax=Caulobacter sp. NIBR1757 TaxID=3016000 RepID=UPI0022EFFF85|nr:septation protein IspZ [Caulobacter sp. NIBR1757]WGM38802.1 intracellular septation protein A [Caulobacter sp. NIBR1757]